MFLKKLNRLRQQDLDPLVSQDIQGRLMDRRHLIL